MWKTLDMVGMHGSENAVITLDEANCLGARITLEKCNTYYVITAGGVL